MYSALPYTPLHVVTRIELSYCRIFFVTRYYLFLHAFHLCSIHFRYTSIYIYKHIHTHWTHSLNDHLPLTEEEDHNALGALCALSFAPDAPLSPRLGVSLRPLKR